jgi:hypothetical protein
VTDLIPRQRRAIEDEQAYAARAYEAHADRCPECLHGDSWCAHGRALLAASAPAGDPDLPGYGVGDLIGYNTI